MTMDLASFLANNVLMILFGELGAFLSVMNVQTKVKRWQILSLKYFSREKKGYDVRKALR